MSNIINSKKKRKNNSGFTLVELLATIAILSIVSVIVIYTATNVIGSAKNNSYKVTINNIQKDANTYVLENDKNINWLNFNDGTNSSYQCIKVQNLIDMGYFDNNILDSLVSEDRNVLANDYIYIEKDNNTKVITKQILLYDTTSPLTSLCGDYINSNGIIDFSFFSEWAKSKDVIITYKLDNDISVGDSNNYNYSYLYNGNCINEDNVCSFGFTTMKTAVKKITLYEEGYLSANITKKDGQTVRTNGVDINKIDTVGPVIENLSLKEISDIKTVRGETSVLIRINDKKNNSNEECNENSELNCGSGLNLDTIKTENFKVSIGGNFINDYQLEKKSCDSSKEINYCNYNLKITNYNYVGDLVIEIEKNKILDEVGNGNNEITLNTNITFDNTYKIKYNANGGAGSMKYTECIYGKNCALRQNTYTRTGYTFLGWSTDDASKSATYKDMHEFKPFNLDTFNSSRNDEGITLYAVWRINKVHIQYNVNGGNIQSSTTSSGGTTYDWSIKNGLIYKEVNKEPILFEQTIEHGKSTDDNGLKNYNNSKYINISNEYHSGVEGKEWVCLSGCTTTNKKFDHTKTYSSNDFCDTTSSDCTVILGVNWRNNVAYIKYNAAGGTIQTETTHNNKTYRWKTVGDIIYRTYNDEETHTFDKIEYGKTNDLSNPDGPTYMIITKEGRSVADENGIDWICNSGNCTQNEYREDTNYEATDLCDLSKKDCTIELKVNWRWNYVYIKLYTNGGTITSSTIYNDKTYSWKKDSKNLIERTLNNEKSTTFENVRYDKTNDLPKPNGSYMTITKTGYIVKSEEEWKCRSNSNCVKETYDESVSYNSKDFCDATSRDCTIELEVNWIPDTYTISYDYNGGSKGSTAPTTATYDNIFNISNPTKTVTITGDANGTGATIGNATSKAQTFAGWTYSDGNTSYAKYGTASTSVTTSWSNGSTKVTAEYFKNLRSTSGTVTLTANWTPVALNLPTISKTGYSCNWNTQSDGKGTSYASGASYTPSATSDQSITVYARCTPYKVFINYKNNNGTLTETTKKSDGSATYNWTTDSNKIIMLNGNAPFFSVKYGNDLGTNGLVNYDNDNYLHISRTGYVAISGEEWICASDNCKGKTYSDSQVYNASDFCDASNGNCTVVLEVNWSQYENKWVQGVKDSYTISPIRTWGGFSAKLRITWKEEYNQYLNQSRVSIINFEMYYPSGGGLGPFYVGGASGETDGIYINDEYVQPMSLVDGKTDFAWSSTAGWKPLNLKPRDYPWTSTEITHKADGTKSVPIKVVLDSTYQNLKFGAAYDDTKYITLTDLR